MRFEGTIKSWNDDRGFGFIEPTQGGQEVFVHIKAFKDLRARPQAGQRLTFQVELGPQGKKGAFNMEPLQLPRKAPPPVQKQGAAQWGTASLLAIPALLLVLLLGFLLGHPPRWALWAYPLVSALTSVAYATDKSAAERGGMENQRKHAVPVGAHRGLARCAGGSAGRPWS